MENLETVLPREMPNLDFFETEIEKLLEIKPIKGKVMVYTRTADLWDYIKAQENQTVLDFLKKHKEAIIRVKGYSVTLTYRYRKVRISRLLATHPVFDEGKLWTQ